MKKRFSVSLFLAAAMIALSFLSCDNTGFAVEKSNISAYVGLRPSALVSSGRTTYSVSVYIEDTTAADGGNFASPEINVNGLTFTGDTDPNYWSESSIVSLGTGDAVTVTVSHPSFGSFEVSGVVPSSVSDFTVTVGFPGAGVQNAATTYDITWPAAAGAVEYLPMVYGYEDADKVNIIDAIGYYEDGTSQTIKTHDENITAYPFFRVYLYAVDSRSIAGLDPGSFFSLRSSNAVVKGNTN